MINVMILIVAVCFITLSGKYNVANESDNITLKI